MEAPKTVISATEPDNHAPGKISPVSRRNPSEKSTQERRITYRGNEEVINIGEPLDVELTQFDDEITGEAIQIGVDLRAETE